MKADLIEKMYEKKLKNSKCGPTSIRFVIKVNSVYAVTSLYNSIK